IVTLYLPGSSASVNAPPWSEVTERGAPPSSGFAVTTAPSREAPLGSKTVPCRTNLEDATWAETVDTTAVRKRHERRGTRQRRMGQHSELICADAGRFVELRSRTRHTRER